MDLADCATPAAQRAKIAGRKRNGMNPILQLLNTGDFGGSKQDVWNSAVDAAIRTAKAQIVEYIDDFLEWDRGGTHASQ